MPTLHDVARGYTPVDGDDLDWLQLLVADWQIIADLSFADLVLWLPDSEGRGFWGGAQMRPTTGPTAYDDDLVGAFVPRGRRPAVEHAFDGQVLTSARNTARRSRTSGGARVEAIPVVREGRSLAVVVRTTNLPPERAPSRLERAYLRTADDLTQMIARGLFPQRGERRDWSVSPRVGDGFVRLDASGTVEYASPNAQSAYRRLGLTGDLGGTRLADVTQELVSWSEVPVDVAVATVLAGQGAYEAELGNSASTLAVRAIPLAPAGTLAGALVLLRDVTEIRIRERQLLTKDATIREIHHRVKNNLQTVAALLRMQARRAGQPEAQVALEEAVRRVGSIAVVHEMLSNAPGEEVDFDEVVDRLRAMVVEVGGRGGAVTGGRTGSFGALPSETATALSMVLTELMQNAVEHGFADADGRLEVEARRSSHRLEVEVSDDGAGLPDGFALDSSPSLGLSIVRTLVESDLGGSLTLTSGGVGAGTVARVTIPLVTRRTAHR